MQVSAIICTHNRPELCRTAIESLLCQQNAGDPYEIIVVDNSNDSKVSDHLAAIYHGRPVRFMHTSSIGLSNARNIGADAASGDIIAYLDDDAIAMPGWVQAIAAAFLNCGPRAGAIGGPVRPIWIEPPPPWMDARFLEIFAIIDRGPAMRPLGPAEWLAGCNIAFARDVLREVGGFDTQLGRIGGALLSNEEIAVCDRIRSTGRQIIYAPDVVVNHVVPPTRATADFVRRRVAWQAASDALAFPDRAREHAVSAEQGWSIATRILKTARFYRVLRRGRKSMSRKDYDFVYDLVNQLLCHESK